MSLQINDVIQYVEENIISFHEKRLNKIETLKLKEVIQKKNPYLFKAKNIQTADEIVKGIVDAYLSSKISIVCQEKLGACIVNRSMRFNS